MFAISASGLAALPTADKHESQQGSSCNIMDSVLLFTAKLSSSLPNYGTLKEPSSSRQEAKSNTLQKLLMVRIAHQRRSSHRESTRRTVQFDYIEQTRWALRAEAPAAQSTSHHHTNACHIAPKCNAMRHDHHAEKATSTHGTLDKTD